MFNIQTFTHFLRMQYQTLKDRSCLVSTVSNHQNCFEASNLFCNISVVLNHQDCFGRICIVLKHEICFKASNLIWSIFEASFLKQYCFEVSVLFTSGNIILKFWSINIVLKHQYCFEVPSLFGSIKSVWNILFWSFRSVLNHYSLEPL